MRGTGGGDKLIVLARSAPLDALDALSDQLDSDLALNTRALADEPLIEKALQDAGFVLNPETNQPGSWLSPLGIPVDLMVPLALSPGPSRGARIPPHSKRAARKAVGLEAAIIDHAPRQIGALAEDDGRVRVVNVAGPAALLVAKLHKVGERQEQRHRLVDKDAHDIYRLLVAVATDELATVTKTLLGDDLSHDVTAAGLEYLKSLFAAGAGALGSMMAGRAEAGIGEPETVSASVSILASDLLSALN